MSWWIVGGMAPAQRVAVTALTFTVALTVTMVVAPVVGAWAQDGDPRLGVANCVRPETPLCIDDLTTFVSPDKMIDCQSRVKDFIDQTMAHLACLKEDHVQVGEEMTAAVNRFNCRLGGRKDCW